MTVPAESFIRYTPGPIGRFWIWASKGGKSIRLEKIKRKRAKGKNQKFATVVFLRIIA
jgi:hypothetical protein